MIYPYLFAYVENAIPKLVCKRIIEHSKFYNAQSAQVTSWKESKKYTAETDENWRKCERKSFSKKWIYDAINPIVDNVNRSHWNFNLDFGENVEYLKYGKEGHFDWHEDQYLYPWNESTTKNIKLYNKIRKISISIQLTDGKKYEGGNLQIEHPTEKKGNKSLIFTLDQPEHRSIGSMIIFPSFLRHKITKITKGTREALVVWYIGDRYK